MRISTKGRYSILLMLDMAKQPAGEPVKIKDISARSGISMKYMEQIVAVLNKAGFVRSVRGAQGGYLLTRKPEEYTVGEILRLSEGSLAPGGMPGRRGSLRPPGQVRDDTPLRGDKQRREQRR